MTAIKICGITRLDDAEAAAALGIHALGFVFWRKSPRFVPLADVRRIAEALPPFVIRVGVFVDPTAEEVRLAVDEGRIAVAQIHGQVPAFPDGRSPVPLLRAVHLGSEVPDGIVPPVLDATVLLDAHDPVRHGGTGTTVDWVRAGAVARSRRVVLAGGLTPANVAEAIRTVRPYAVDVASGVEVRPGVKDHDLLRRFIAAAKEAV